MSQVRLLSLALLFACSGTKTNEETGQLAEETGTEDGDTAAVDGDRDGSTADEDCDDGDASVHPGADEVCDGLDNDCDDLVDDGDTDVVGDATYNDADGDGYGDDETRVVCGTLDNPVSEGGDCDDSDPAYHPGADETDCEDPNDYNCDGSVSFDDADGDGFSACEDCDDANAGANPDADEVCDGVDNDCDDLLDDQDPDVEIDTTWYGDADGDGHGEPLSPVFACEQPDGTSAVSTDCDDSDASVSPDAVELCNDVDDDCDGYADDEDDDVTGLDTWYKDDDDDDHGDADDTAEACDAPRGYVADGTDCDDGDDDVYPGAAEVCDDEDNDCDELVDQDDPDLEDGGTWYEDGDRDGYGDDDSAIFSCDAVSGYTTVGGDCDDDDDDINPSETETCDGQDQDCDDVVDDGDDCPCTQDWYGGHSYLYCEGSYYTYSSWTGSESYCEGYGYDLVTLDDASEDAEVYANASALDGDDWWIGLNDRTTEGTWAWESGIGVAYTNWYPGQPDGGSSHDCARYLPEYDEGWYDTYCEYGYSYNFICESPE